MSEPAAPQPESPPADDAGTPATTHGDPLLAASKGEQEGTEGSRHGLLPAPHRDEG